MSGQDDARVLERCIETGYWSAFTEDNEPERKTYREALTRLIARCEELERERDEALLPSVEEAQDVFTKMRLRERAQAAEALLAECRGALERIARGDFGLATKATEFARDTLAKLNEAKRV